LVKFCRRGPRRSASSSDLLWKARAFSDRLCYHVACVCVFVSVSVRECTCICSYICMYIHAYTHLRESRTRKAVKTTETKSREITYAVPLFKYTFLTPQKRAHMLIRQRSNRAKSHRITLVSYIFLVLQTYACNRYTHLHTYAHTHVRTRTHTYIIPLRNEIKNLLKGHFVNV
jgi:hypothetical protein